MKQIKRLTGLCLALAMSVSTLLPYAAAAETETAEPVNYARDCEVMSNTSGESKSASNVIDGNEATDWSTYSSTQNGSVELALPQATVINKITVQNGKSVPRDVKLSIETSPDGYDWHMQQKDVALSSGKKAEIYIDNTTCEYVRVNVYDVTPTGSGYYGFSISEIGLYREEGTDTAALSAAVQSADTMLSKFRAMDTADVTVSEEGYALLQRLADEGRQIIADAGASQYAIDEKIKAIADAKEKFIDMAIFSDVVFEEILENQKQRQLGDNPTFGDSNDLWQSMNKGEGVMQLWGDKDVKPEDYGSVMGGWFDNLYKMARSYMCKSSNQGNEELRSDIEWALDWFYKNVYNENSQKTGNWWNWEIGTPKRIILTLTIMKDDLNPAVIQNLCNAMTALMGDYIHSDGANRTDRVLVAIQTAAFQKDGATLYRAQQSILGDLCYVDEGTDAYDPGNGHYTDGSFLYHNGVAFNANYGKETLSSLSGILKLTRGTVFQVDNSYLEILTEWAVNAYDPLAYYGIENLAVMGRGIYDGVGRANQIGGILHNIADCVSGADEALIDSLAMKMKREKSTENLLADTNWTRNKRYPSMDIVVHSNDKYNFTVNMFSPRTTPYEATNGQDMLGWYQGLGAMYLYTADNTYFDDGYQETIDPYRLPGITVDTLNMTNKRWHGEKRNTHDFVGGASVDNYGVEAMELSQTDTDLYGKKSWFLFDDEIVFLGSDIKANSGRPIETVVDNRKIGNDNSNRLVIDGAEKSNDLGKVQQFVPSADPSKGAEVPRGTELAKGYQETISSAGWAWLEGNKNKGVGNGYVFPKKATLEVKRESRTGCKAVTEFNGDKTEVTRNWVTMWMNHGVNPTNTSYEYILLPEKTQAEVEAYAANPQIEVVEHSGEAHAVRETVLNVLGVNSFAEGGKTVENVTVDKPASYMLRETEQYFEISVSDPTQRETGKIHVEVAIAGDKILMSDERIQNVSLGDIVSFDVDVKLARGKDSRIVVGKKGVFTEVDETAFRNTYLQIGTEAAIAGGKPKTVAAPIEENGISYIPLRFAAEALNGRVSWEGETQRVQIITDEHVVLLTIGSDVMKVDGQDVHIPAAPRLVNDTTMLPLRAVAEVLGAEVNWDGQNSTVEIVPAGGESCLQETGKIFAGLK